MDDRSTLALGSDETCFPSANGGVGDDPIDLRLSEVCPPAVLKRKRKKRGRERNYIADIYHVCIFYVTFDWCLADTACMRLVYFGRLLFDRFDVVCPPAICISSPAFLNLADSSLIFSIYLSNLLGIWV